MRPADVALMLLLACAVGAAATEQDEGSAGHSDPIVPAGPRGTWSASLDVYLYLQEEDDFLMPILAADRDALHFECRYQYEDFETVSAWVGWSFDTGESLQIELVPMAGIIVGRTTGIGPGLEMTLSWKDLEFYSESEYVFDSEGVEGDYFYTWSELSWQALPWLKLGASAQRTRLYRSELDIERGLFVAVSRGPIELSVYGYNLDGDSPFVITALGVSF
jgi:hypothetical protein